MIRLRATTPWRANLALSTAVLLAAAIVLSAAVESHADVFDLFGNAKPEPAPEAGQRFWEEVEKLLNEPTWRAQVETEAVRVAAPVWRWDSYLENLLRVYEDVITE